MGDRLFILLIMVLAFSVIFSPLIFNHACILYVFSMITIVALSKYLPYMEYLMVLMFFVAFFLEIRWSDISFKVNAPQVFSAKPPPESEHFRIKLLISTHYIVLLLIFILLSFYAYQAVSPLQPQLDKSFKSSINIQAEQPFNEHTLSNHENKYYGKGPNGEGIKGHIGKSGKIYHIPGSTYYDRTRHVSQWFFTEREAQEAGYRPPLK